MCPSLHCGYIRTNRRVRRPRGLGASPAAVLLLYHADHGAGGWYAPCAGDVDNVCIDPGKGVDAMDGSMAGRTRMVERMPRGTAARRPSERRRSARIGRVAGVAGGVLLGLRLARALRGHFGWDLRGRAVLLTGGSRGLGLALAEELAAAGARVAICSRDEEELANARRILAARGAPDVLALRADLSKREEAERLVERAVGHFGGLDVLVNDAGIIAAGPLLSLTLADFEQVMAVNFWGAVYVTSAALPHLLESRGRLVNITSIGGKVSVPHLLPYSCAKFALVAYSEGLRAELAKEGVTVVTVVPGLMRTGSYLNTIVKGEPRKEFAAFALLDSLPLTAMSARRAARQIVAATRRGDAEIILSWQAQLAARMHGLFPGATGNLLALVDRLLPGVGPTGTARTIGKEDESALTRSPLTALNQRAADELNEHVAQPPAPGGDVDTETRPTRPISSV